MHPTVKSGAQFAIAKGVRTVFYIFSPEINNLLLLSRISEAVLQQVDQPGYIDREYSVLHHVSHSCPRSFEEYLIDEHKHYPALLLFHPGYGIKLYTHL